MEQFSPKCISSSLTSIPVIINDVFIMQQMLEKKN